MLETFGWPWSFSPKVRASSSSLCYRTLAGWRLLLGFRLHELQKIVAGTSPRHAVDIHHVFNSRTSSGKTGRNDDLLATGVAISRRSSLAIVVRVFALMRARGRGKFILLLPASTEQKLNNVIVDLLVALYG